MNLMTTQDERIFVRVIDTSGTVRDWGYIDKQDAQNAADVLSARPDVKSAEVIVKRDQLSDALNQLATSIEKLCSILAPEVSGEAYRYCYAKWNDGMNVHECTKPIGHDGDHGNRVRSWPAFSGDAVSSDLRQCGAIKPGSTLHCERPAGHDNTHIAFDESHWVYRW